MTRPNPSNVECEACGDAPDEASHQPGARKLCDRCRAQLKKEAMKTPAHVTLPLYLQEANERSLIIEDAQRRVFVHRHFSEEDRKVFRDFMHEDLLVFQFIILACNNHDDLVSAAREMHGFLQALVQDGLAAFNPDHLGKAYFKGHRALLELDRQEGVL